MTSDPTGIARPTIREALREFLDEQEKRLAPRTFSQYKSVIELLQHCLDGYGHSDLDEEERKLYERLCEERGEEPEFCDVFGPAHIAPMIGEFLNYFMIRKVMAGKDLLRAAGTVTKKLAKWLETRGYAEPEEAEDVASRGASAARDLPAARDLVFLIDESSYGITKGLADVDEGHFTVERVSRGKLLLRSMGGREIGPIEVPEEASDIARRGWTISGIVGRSGKSWVFAEAWNVYPR